MDNEKYTMSLVLGITRSITLNNSKEYTRLKRTLKNSTAGYGSALSASYFITQGADQGVSAALGAVASYAYMTLLSDRVDIFPFVWFNFLKRY